jgi:hypothetical protein
MMRRYLVFAGLATAMVLPLGAQAQSLADVARAEEARRKTVKQPAKVYTNDDLKPSSAFGQPVGSDAPAAPDAGNAATGSASPASDTAAVDKAAKDEKYWKDRITLARTTLDHDRVLVDAVQSRINALTTEFVNTGDPAQRALVDRNRTVALAELDRLNKDIQTQTKAVSDIQEEARKASVPAGWLR